MPKSLLVDPNWDQLLSKIEIPSGINLKTDRTAQCHLLSSLIIHLGLPLGDLLTFLFNTPIANVQQLRALEKLYIHRYKLPIGPRIDDLPPEILHSIFERAILPPILLDPSIDTRRYTIDIWAENLRTIKSLSQVCQRWHGHIMPFLYGHITIHRIHQIPRLLHTLQQNSSTSEPVRGLGRLVREIEIVCAFASTKSLQNKLDQDKQAARNRSSEALADVLALCPNLISVTFAPTGFNYSRDLQYIRTLSNLSITSLTLNICPCPYSGLEFLFTKLAPHLLFLSITQRSRDYSQPDGDVLTSINFPKLESLHCYASSTAQLISSCWTFPSLRRLTYIADPYPPDDTIGLRCLIEKFGSGLTYLHILWCRAEIEECTFIFEKCPKLVRLVVPGVSLENLPGDAAVPAGLRWLDMHGGWSRDHKGGHSDDDGLPSLASGESVSGGLRCRLLMDNEEFFEALQARIPSLRRLRALCSIGEHLYRWLETYPDLDSVTDVLLASELEELDLLKKEPPYGELVIDMYDHRLRCTPRLVDYLEIKRDWNSSYGYNRRASKPVPPTSDSSSFEEDEEDEEEYNEDEEVEAVEEEDDEDDEDEDVEEEDNDEGSARGRE